MQDVSRLTTADRDLAAAKFRPTPEFGVLRLGLSKEVEKSMSNLNANRLPHCKRNYPVFSLKTILTSVVSSADDHSLTPIVARVKVKR